MPMQLSLLTKKEKLITNVEIFNQNFDSENILELLQIYVVINHQCNVYVEL